MAYQTFTTLGNQRNQYQGTNFTRNVGPKNRRVSMMQGGQVVKQSGYDLGNGERVLGQTYFEPNKPPVSPKTTLPLPNTFPAPSLASGLDRADVLAKRNNLQGQIDQTNGVNTQLSAMQEGVGGIGANPLKNPDKFLMQFVQGGFGQTQAEQQQQGILGGIADQTRSFFGGRGEQRDAVYNQFGVNNARQELGNTRKRIADRQVKMREELRKYDSAGRGIARVFSEDQRQKLVNDATTELADLSIIENAQNGNLNTAIQMANDVIDAQYEDFKGQIDAYKADLAALEPTLNKEQQQQALQIKMALDERSRLLEEEAANEKEKRTVMAQAAAEGADNDTLEAIRTSKNVGEAYLHAGPWLGRQDRMNSAANRANIYSQIQDRTMGQLIDLAKLGQPDAISKLGFDPRALDENETDTLAYAQQYAATGMIPTGLKDAGLTLGDIMAVAKTLPQGDGTVASSITGVKDTSMPAAQQDDLARLYQIKKLTAELKELDKERWGGAIAGTVGKVFGSEAQTKYLTTRKAIIDEISRMQTGAAMTESEKNFYSDYLPGRFSNTLFFGAGSDTKIDAFDSFINSRLSNLLSNNSLVIHGYSDTEIGGQKVKIGAIIEREDGAKFRVNADSSLTPLN